MLSTRIRQTLSMTVSEGIDSNLTANASDHVAKLPTGVTIEDVERMGELAEEDRRPSTRRVYWSKWRGFLRFCDERDVEPLPATPSVGATSLRGRSTVRR